MNHSQIYEITTITTTITIFTNPSARQDMTQGQFLNGV